MNTKREWELTFLPVFATTLHLSHHACFVCERHGTLSDSLQYVYGKSHVRYIHVSIWIHVSLLIRLIFLLKVVKEVRAERCLSEIYTIEPGHTACLSKSPHASSLGLYLTPQRSLRMKSYICDCRWRKPPYFQQPSLFLVPKCRSKLLLLVS